MKSTLTGLLPHSVYMENKSRTAQTLIFKLFEISDRYSKDSQYH